MAVDGVCSAAGECLGRFTNKKTPYCVRFNPDEDKQNLFLTGCADKKIYCVSYDFSIFPFFIHPPFLLFNFAFSLPLYLPPLSLSLPPCLCLSLPVSIQFNIDSGEIVQEYDRHLGSVNTITFVDENRRFVTTSDDKSLRVWEWSVIIYTTPVIIG